MTPEPATGHWPLFTRVGKREYEVGRIHATLTVRDAESPRPGYGALALHVESLDYEIFDDWLPSLDGE